MVVGAIIAGILCCCLSKENDAEEAKHPKDDDQSKKKKDEEKKEWLKYLSKISNEKKWFFKTKINRINILATYIKSI